MFVLRFVSLRSYLTLRKSSLLVKATEAYHQTASTSLGYIQTASEVLSENGAQDDKATGMTPCRRTWDYGDQWNLTKPRETILKVWREQGAANVGCETSVPEHISLAEIDGLDEGVGEDALVETENIPLTTSTTSSIFTPLTQPIKIGSGHPKLRSSASTLTDAKNVYTTRGLRRG